MMPKFKKNISKKWRLSIISIILVIFILCVMFFSIHRERTEHAKQLTKIAKQRYQTLIHTQGLPTLDNLLNTLETITAANLVSTYVPSEKNALQTMQKNCLHKLFLPMLDYYYKSTLVSDFQSPQKLYPILKAYLMLGDRQHLDINTVYLTTKSLLPKQKLKYFKQFLKKATQAPFAGYPINQTIVTAARAHFATLDAEQQAIAILSSHLAQPVQLYQASTWFKPNVAFIPARYTKEFFNTVTNTIIPNASKAVLFGSWVLGKRNNTQIKQTDLSLLVYNDFLMAYVKRWEAVLSAIRLNPPTSLNQLTTLLNDFSQPNSSLKTHLNPIYQNTDLPQVMALSKPLTDVNQLFLPQSQAFATLQTKLIHVLTTTNKLLANKAAEFAWVKHAIVYKNFNPITVSASLPAPLAQWVAQLSKTTWTLIFARYQRQLNHAWLHQINVFYQHNLNEHFPLAAPEFPDASLTAFNNFFKPTGLLQTFLKRHLALLINTNQTPWQWQKIPGLKPADKTLLTQLRNASTISSELYQRSLDTPEKPFSLTPIALSPNSQKFILNINTQWVLLDQNSKHTTSKLLWQPRENGSATIQFQDADDNVVNDKQTGPWAFLRVLTTAIYNQTHTNAMTVSFNLGNQQAHYQLSATHPKLPFDVKQLTQFRLPSRLFLE